MSEKFVSSLAQYHGLHFSVSVDRLCIIYRHQSLLVVSLAPRASSVLTLLNPFAMEVSSGIALRYIRCARLTYTYT